MAKKRGRRPVLESASIAVLERALAKRRSEVERLEKQRDRLVAQLADVETRLGAVLGKGVPSRPPAATTTTAARKPGPRPRRRGGMSLAEAVAGVLKDAGSPMRVVEIAGPVQAAGYTSKAKRFDKMVHKAINNLATAKRVGRGRYVYVSPKPARGRQGTGQ